jgi:hypothetical protein
MTFDDDDGHGGIIHGDIPKPFRVRLNGVWQEPRYDTFEEARASVTRIDLHIEIWNRRTRVLGKDLPNYPPRPGEKKR